MGQEQEVASLPHDGPMSVLLLSLFHGIIISRCELAAVQSIRLCSHDWQSNELKLLPSSNNH